MTFSMQKIGYTQYSEMIDDGKPSIVIDVSLTPLPAEKTVS